MSGRIENENRIKTRETGKIAKTRKIVGMRWPIGGR